MLPPLPNTLFTRDSSCWIYGGVSINPMYWPARRREAYNVAAIYRGHPMFADGGFDFWYPTEGPDGRLEATDFGLSSLEGGDVMPIGNGVVLIGMSERSQGADDRADRQVAVRQGSRRPRDRLRDDQGSGAHAPRHGVHAARPRQGDRLPQGRGQHPGDQPAPGKRDGDFHVTVEDDFVGAVADALGVDTLHVVETGGDTYQQEREQWDDGNNVVALEPGVVVAYERNTYTIAKMRRAAWRSWRSPGSSSARAAAGDIA